jgi:hypothetical protein
MGLITKTIPILQPTKVVADGSSSELGESSKRFDPSIYRIMSSTESMKTLEYPESIRSEFDRFLELAELKVQGTTTLEFDALDEYLSTFVDNSGDIEVDGGSRNVVVSGSAVVNSGNNVVHMRGN